MIKSLLDDEEDRNEEEEPRSGFLKRSFRSEEILSIDLSSAPDEDQAAPGESEEEIRQAIMLGPSSEGERAPQRDVWRNDSGDSKAEPDPLEEHERRASELERKLHEIETELQKERESLRVSRMVRNFEQRQSSAPPVPRGEGLEYATGTEPVIETQEPASVPSFGTAPGTESSAESFRKSGMAWSAGIALFGSVVFMLVLGWFADLLFGSSPWGVVFGVVLGSIIGFIQFFRITAQIHRPSRSDFDRVSLRSEEGPSEDKGTSG